LNNLAVYQ